MVYNDYIRTPNYPKKKTIMNIVLLLIQHNNTWQFPRTDRPLLLGSFAQLLPARRTHNNNIILIFQYIIYDTKRSYFIITINLFYSAIFLAILSRYVTLISVIKMWRTNVTRHVFCWEGDRKFSGLDPSPARTSKVHTQKCFFSVWITVRCHRIPLQIVDRVGERTYHARSLPWSE